MHALAPELKKYRQVFVVCDRNVEAFAREISGVEEPFCITADEAHKTMDTVMDICRALLSAGAGREALRLAVGGGVTTDLAGFAASIYKRGIRYANVPTTLLGQVDAGIGGKTGVNLDGFKNEVGTIRQPEFTAVFPEVLESLPEKELRSGLAEMLKTFVIKNPAHAYERTVALFAAARANGGLCPAVGDSELPELIRAAAGIKQAIVDKDEFEKGGRRKLNLGHSWAHAIEWWQSAAPGRTDLSHGEAVAIGIVQAARLAEKLGLAEEPGLPARLSEELQLCGLPSELPCPQGELLPAMRNDKKAESGRIRLVLPVKVGKVIVKQVNINILEP